MLFADIDDRAAGWIFFALRDYKRSMGAGNGLKPPPGVDELMDWCYSRARRGQTGSVVASLGQLADAEPVERSMVKYDEAAHVLGVSRSVVKRLVDSGQLPTVKVLGAVRIRTADLKAYVESLATIDRTGGAAA